MADLHNDITYKGWGKASMVYHRECMVILINTVITCDQQQLLLLFLHVSTTAERYITSTVCRCFRRCVTFQLACKATHGTQESYL